jgi:hypothetical protein
MLEQWRRSSFTLPVDRAGDPHVAVLGKLPATQFPLRDHLEPGALEVERLDARFRRRALIEETLEDSATDPDGALVGTENSTQSRSSFHRPSSGN